MSGKHAHALPLWGLFLALLALTAGEVGLYEVWRHTLFVPKYVIVLIVLTLTLPKAAIVLVYFMHLRFERVLVVMLALVPLLLVFIAVLPPLTDIATLKLQERYRANHEITGHGPSHHKPVATAGQPAAPRNAEEAQFE